MILVATSFVTRKPWRTASSLENNVQKRSFNISTFNSNSFVSVADNRSRLDLLCEERDKDIVTREESELRLRVGEETALFDGPDVTTNED